MPNSKWKHPNAHKQGVFAASAILPGESQREFEELHFSLTVPQPTNSISLWIWKARADE